MDLLIGPFTNEQPSTTTLIPDQIHHKHTHTLTHPILPTQTYLFHTLTTHTTEAAYTRHLTHQTTTHQP